MSSKPPNLVVEGPGSAAPAARAETVVVVTPDRAPPRMTAAALVVTVAVVGLSMYANLSHLVTHRADFRFFPPFEAGINNNNNEHLGAEYYSIAGAIVAGRGFADPFKEETGPTAWMPPMLAWLLAGLRWLTGNDTEIVMALFILLQDLTLVATGLLVLALARRTTNHVWPAALVFLGALLFYFRHCFQFTHDCWIILLALDALIAGMVWLRPFESSRRRAFGWGVAGGLMALVSPIVGLSWAVLAVAGGSPRGRRTRLVIAAAASMLTVSPWVIRNYLVFDRFLPVKSNLAYELYQSQCLESEGVPIGVLRGFPMHPFANAGEERWEYKRVGEMSFLDKKWQLFVESVQADPMGFFERVANRFFAATLEYIPFEVRETRRPWMLLATKIIFPLPFLAILFLLLSAPWEPLGRDRWIVIGVYVSYLLPYIIVSYYDRYKFPLMVTEVLLVVWGVDRLLKLRQGRPTAETLAVEDAVLVAEESDAGGAS